MAKQNLNRGSLHAPGSCRKQRILDNAARLMAIERFKYCARGVKQGDILSPVLVNAGLKETVRSWTNGLAISGIHIGHFEWLRNIRFADAFMLYSKAKSELVYMLEMFFFFFPKVTQSWITAEPQNTILTSLHFSYMLMQTKLKSSLKNRSHNY